MKKLKTHRYLLVTVMGLLVACTSYTSTDEWPNPRPNSNPDPEPVIGEITSIQSLNKSENVAVNSHADEWGNSSLELDYRRLLTLESPALSAVNALYPRIKKLGDGTYLLLYQQGPQAWNVYYALSTNLITWQNASSPLFQSERKRMPKYPYLPEQLHHMMRNSVYHWHRKFAGHFRSETGIQGRSAE